MPAKKKDASTRARRNKATTQATLTTKLVVALEDYSQQTVAALRAEIDRRNESRPEGQQLARTGTKPALVERLTNDDDPTPKLPDRPAGWSEQTRQWWADVWASPMSNEWHESDVHNLFVCAMLYDDMWMGETATARQKAAAEFRQQRAVLGLTPYDRRRLEWTIETADEAKTRGQQRRSAGQPPAPPTGKQPPAVDPRFVHAQQ